MTNILGSLCVHVCASELPVMARGRMIYCMMMIDDDVAGHPVQVVVFVFLSCVVNTKKK